MMKQLLQKIFGYRCISRSLEHTGKYNTILGIRWQYMVSLSAMKSRGLYRCYSNRGPRCSPGTNSLIASRLININKVVRAVFRHAMKIGVPQVRITLSSNPTSCFLRPSN
ncbi:hypothetical protein ASPBRDRAFT_667206 [Aspergillus brasiliensis CBS 101740]|uniref:Uncharacterized protein n=1 Tax=Aspergillus brasiliensis (strain CBS 101740 / IMI 381727 / IBT 21946) TaxID=767769 RepID=A0A1L9U2E4_ASPBC|nr:hypothetical protein ASPBRDRAFT_667206 [Aspergillus brasiliensis CBS 101740]